MMEKENGNSSESGAVGWRILRITALMAGIYVFFHLLPDFAPERPATFLRQATGDTSPELCHFSSLGFTQVNQSRSPLILRLLAHSSPRAGEEVRVTASLARPGGRPVSFADLEEKHTEKFHLLIVDPTLGDYQHHHPEPTSVPGEYHFTFRPRHGGTYRFYAEVVPLVTGRPVQAVADLEVAGEEAARKRFSTEATVEDVSFYLMPPEDGLRARRPAILSFDIRHRNEGRSVTLEPVMGAWAHIVAFDQERTGFAHMHPLQENLELQLDPVEPELDFMFYATEPGLYTIWGQVKIDGAEIFVPFSVEVL